MKIERGKNSLNITDLDKPGFDNLVARAAAAGLELTGQSGSVQMKGVTVAYDYEPESKWAILRVVKKPLLYPMGTVLKKIEEAITGSAEPAA